MLASPIDTIEVWVGLTGPEAFGNLVLLRLLITDLLIRLLSPLIHLLVVLLNVLTLGRRGFRVEDFGLGTID